MTELENLPDHLIHYIMNFLPYKNATKCSVLSKAFKSLWLSSHILEFDGRFFVQHEDREDRLFSHILETLQLRSPHTNNSLQKFRLFHQRMWSDPPFSYQPTFDMLVNFAIENTSKEIVFEIISGGFINVRYEPLVKLFSSEFLTVLNLTGLRIPIADSIIHCPKLKALKIRICEGLSTITVSSSCVEEVCIDSCHGLEGFQVPRAKNLFRFEFGPGFHPCEFDLPTCESIVSMDLCCAEVSKNNLTVPVIDTLCIVYCRLPPNFRIQNPKLKELKVRDVFKLENLSLFTPNLERFCFAFSDGFHPSQNRRITMNISSCVPLTLLELEGVAITDEWVESVISNLVCLKELIITSCTFLRKMKLKNDKLEILSLKICSDLKEAIIDAPNLLKFEYEKSLKVYPLTISSTKCCAKIKFPRCRIDPILWFDKINRFLSSFDHVQDITIVCFKAKEFIFPIEHVSENNPFTLRDVKYMKVQALGEKPDSEDVIKMIEGLLWLVPKPLTLTCDRNGTLKFEYGKEVRRTNVEERFCSGVLPRCWVHYELKVEIQGFNEYERRDLNKLFSPYMHSL